MNKKPAFILIRLFQSFYFRLVISFLMIIFLLVISVPVTLYQFEEVIKTTDSLSSLSNAQVGVNGMRAALLEENLRISQFVMLNQSQALTEYNSRTSTSFSREIDSYMASKYEGPDESDFIATLRERKFRLDQFSAQIADFLNSNQDKAAIDLLKGDFNKQANSLNDFLNAKDEILDVQTEVQHTKTNESINSARQLLLLGGIAIGFISIISAITLTILLGRSVQRLKKGVVALAKGNLKARVQHPGNDELGHIGQIFNAMATRLRRLIADIEQKRQIGLVTSREVNTIVEQLSIAASQQYTVASEQASTLGELTRSLDELQQTAGYIANRANEVATNSEASLKNVSEVKELVIQTRVAGQAGRSQVEESLQSSVAVQHQVNEFGQVLQALNSQSFRIGEIVNTMAGIADQTHMLALNAAIECAGAGQYGARFRVVATQVKELAEHSRRASTEVNLVISNLRHLIEQSSSAMGETIEKVENSVTRSQQVHRAINQLSESIESMDSRFTLIVTSMEVVSSEVSQIRQTTYQQQSSTEQVTTSIRSIDSATREAASTSQQLAATARQLEELSKNLTQKLAA